MQSPDFMNSLTGILLRFRQNQVAITCDIESMFHQFRVANTDQDYLRFLWFNDQGSTALYRMKVHLFGATSSPACATYGLRYIAHQLSQEDQISKNAVEFITDNFYVDDGILSVADPTTAIQVFSKAIEICHEGNVRLHKVLSNSRKVVEAFPKAEQISSLQNLDLNTEALPTERTFGMLWNSEQDCFQYEVNMIEKPNTKRGILSNVASIFDPLGLVSPVILQGKSILQDICRQKLDWDDALDRPTLKSWLA
ncbi:uncharacterized protein [Watersipora subatra]|uniref:uncharacterized protein n=1 Tax=Watersipora subatra TaxID=2589382 RepID=UPI00355B6761